MLVLVLYYLIGVFRSNGNTKLFQISDKIEYKKIIILHFRRLRRRKFSSQIYLKNIEVYLNVMLVTGISI